MKRIFFILLLLISSITFSQDISGQWNGVLEVQGTSLHLNFNINKNATGFDSTMDSPDQGAKGIPVTTTTFENRVLKLAITNAGIEYEGNLDANNQFIGNFKQAGRTFPMNLSFSKIEKELVEETSKEVNVNYIETDIVLETKTGKLFGTLTTPKQFSKIPVALIIAGSGPTDRNCNNSMMKSDAYKKLAHELAEKNIATVRFDKRGIAASTAAGLSESELRFENYVTDANDWIQLLKKDKRFSKIAIIGHSEGSTIGIMAATNADNYISIAGPGQSADKTLKEQLGAQSKEIQEATFPIIESLANGKIVENVDPNFNSLFRKSVQPYLISWFQYDPQVEIKKLNIPILIIQGTNDIQVSVDDAKRLSNANPKAKLLLIEKMNHIFRVSDGDRQANIATYDKPYLPLAPELVKAISDFILKK